MKRTPMVRTAFKPAEPKPLKGVRPKKCANRSCRAPYLPDVKQPWKVWCSDDCGVVIALDKLAKQKTAKAKKERAEDKAKKETFKRRNDYVADAQRAFNAFVRERDKDQPCICCGRATTSVDGLGSHGWDCGHWRSTGSAPHLRFHENNAHRQLVYCNRNLSGNSVSYRVGLIARIGLAEVEALEADNEPRKWSIDELKQIKSTYTAKLKQLKEHS